MIPRQVGNPGELILLLIEAWEEIIDTICRKYPDRVPAAVTDEQTSFGTTLYEFEALLSRYGGDPEIQQIIVRRFRDCEMVINTFPAESHQRYDFFSGLDEGSRVILRTLYEQKYATLDELSAISGLTQYDVLNRLQEVLIPLSIKRWGKPVVAFRESEIDLSTGNHVSFSWWLNAEVLRKTNAVEVVETGDSLIVTLDRSGYDLQEALRAKANCTNGILEITVDKKKGRRRT
jgi:hypothetical protein